MNVKFKKLKLKKKGKERILVSTELGLETDQLACGCGYVWRPRGDDSQAKALSP